VNIINLDLDKEELIMKSIFKFNKDLCTACGACLLACIDQNDSDIDNEELFRKIFTREDGEFVEYFSLGCLHCGDAKCMDVCSKNCFSRDRDFVILDNSLCIGCKKCSSACEFEAINFSKDRKANKCNGCKERLERNLGAPCVKVCPTGALTLEI
jgi:anaerobic dimethyl sulfoxide reductase subunit B (iron-sulfur subunit)